MGWWEAAAEPRPLKLLYSAGTNAVLQMFGHSIRANKWRTPPPRKQSERQSREVKAPLGLKKPALGIVASEPLTVTITIFFFATERLPM